MTRTSSSTVHPSNTLNHFWFSIFMLLNNFDHVLHAKVRSLVLPIFVENNWSIEKNYEHIMAKVIKLSAVEGGDGSMEQHLANYLKRKSLSCQAAQLAATPQPPAPPFWSYLYNQLCSLISRAFKKGKNPTSFLSRRLNAYPVQIRALNYESFWR